MIVKHSRYRTAYRLSTTLSLCPALLTLALTGCFSPGQNGQGDPARDVQGERKRVSGETSHRVPQVRVLTYNIHHGEGVDGKIDLERIAKVIRDSKAQVVALQEIDRGTRRSGGVDQLEELKRLTGMNGVFGRTIDFQGGQYGNAVLFNLKYLYHKVHPLPGDGEPRAVLEVALSDKYTSGRGDGRKEGQAKEEVKSRGFRVFATHLDHRRDGGVRLAAARHITETIMKDLTRPAILLGDLNALPDSAPLKVLGNAWSNATEESHKPTVPVDHPKRQIDYVLYHPSDAWKVLETKVLDERIASDHRPLLVILAGPSRPDR